jgi:hypothetical protein
MKFSTLHVFLGGESIARHENALQGVKKIEFSKSSPNRLIFVFRGFSTKLESKGIFEY